MLVTDSMVQALSANVDKEALEARNRIAKQMTPAQIADAQRLAREWVEAQGAGAE